MIPSNNTPTEEWSWIEALGNSAYPTFMRRSYLFAGTVRPQYLQIMDVADT